MTRSMFRPMLPALGLVLLSLAAAPAAAQIPDEFTNLKLLDEDIDKRRLVGIMRDWAGGLGVRCSHCHVGPDNLQGMDFASDEKETKRAARVMLEMSRAINRQYVGSWDEDDDARHQVVACYTCHRGQPKPPRKLTWVLGETVTSQGVDAAMTQYEELKTEHYGAGRYDFREQIFGELAQTAVNGGQLDVALEVLRSSLEIYPESAHLHAFLGMGLIQSGDVEEAAKKFDEALDLDPENRTAQRGKMTLERMRRPADGGGDGD